jgi:hypothetical protein
MYEWELSVVHGASRCNTHWVWWEVGAISQNCVGWYFAVQFLATSFGPFKSPPSSNLKYTKRGHLIHQINNFIFRAVSYQLFYYGCLGPETKYKQEIKWIKPYYDHTPILSTWKVSVICAKWALFNDVSSCKCYTASVVNEWNVNMEHRWTDTDRAKPAK